VGAAQQQHSCSTNGVPDTSARCATGAATATRATAPAPDPLPDAHLCWCCLAIRLSSARQCRSHAACLHVWSPTATVLPACMIATQTCPCTAWRSSTAWPPVCPCPPSLCTCTSPTAFARVREPRQVLHMTCSHSFPRSWDSRSQLFASLSHLAGQVHPEPAGAPGVRVHPVTHP
jgi:hypothetical protein